VGSEYGYWLAVSGEPKEAIPHLERAQAEHPSAQGALRLGLARARAGDLEAAERELRHALELKPAYGAARVALGNLLRKRGANDEAVELLLAAAASGSNEHRARALVALGAAQVAAGHRNDAERSFDQAVLFAPARAEVRLGIARAWLAGDTRQDAEKALAVLLRTAELTPDLAAVYASIGRAREKLGDTAQAQEAYDRALRLDPSYRYVRRRLLRLALQSRDFQRARREADRLVSDAPGDPEHHFLAALVADREGRREEARRAYLKAIEVAGGDYPEAYLNLGVLEKGAGDLAAAQTAYEKALTLRPAYGAAWMNLAKLHEGAGRSAEAEATYRKALDIDPRSATVWLGLGQLYAGLGRFEEGVAALRKALELKPGYDAAQLSLGVAYAKAGRHDEAVATYRALLHEEPRYVSAWYDLALALEAQGHLAEAREALEKALALDGTHEASLRELAELDLRERRLADARRRFGELLDASPGDVPARAALAEVAALDGDRPGCEAAARRLRAEAPRDERVAGLAARCAAVPTRIVTQ
jgi:tetratricopeptide (TPR) repeat protein